MNTVAANTPAKAVDLDLTRPIETIDGLAGYRAVHALIRVGGTPIGQIRVPVANGRCPARSLFEPVASWYRTAVARELLHRALARPIPERGIDLPELLASGPDGAGLEEADAPPLVTVAVCTRDRPADLERCLDGLRRIDYPRTEVIVVDNAPRTDVTERVVRSSLPSARYVREPRPGLNWARNRAVGEAGGEIVAFTDDDVVVDPGWVRAYVRLFEATPEVMAATGLVAPYELETEAQLLFEHFGAFGQGFDRRWGKVDREAGERAAARYGATGGFGTGANMAFRRGLFRDIGLFDPALDVGTPTSGGGDLEILFRALKEGHTLVREPRAVVRHRHREEYEELRRQLGTWGIGLYAYVLRSCGAYPDERAGFLRMTWWWLGLRFPRRLAHSLRSKRFPHRLLVDEMRGIFLAPARYRAARRAAAAIEAEMGPIPPPDAGPGLEAAPCVAGNGPGPASAGAARARADRRAAEVRREASVTRVVDLEEGLPTMIDAAHARLLEIDVRRHGTSLGRVALVPAGRPVRSAELRDAFADALAPGAHALFRNLDSVEPGIRISSLLRHR